MVWNIGGVTGGLTKIVEDEVEERFGSSVTDQTASITAANTALALLAPKYMTFSCATTATGYIGFTVNYTELAGLLHYEFSPAPFRFTKQDAGGTYYLFTMNIPINSAVTSTTIQVRHKPVSSAEYDYYVRAQENGAGANTLNFSFTIKLLQGEYIAFATNAATTNNVNRGYSQITRLG